MTESPPSGSGSETPVAYRLRRGVWVPVRADGTVIEPEAVDAPGAEAARKLDAQRRAMPRWKRRAVFASPRPLGPRERRWLLRGQRGRFVASQLVHRFENRREPRARRARTARVTRAGPDDSDPPLAFARFDATLAFLPASARCRLFLALPERVQAVFWRDLARRTSHERET